jgi:hypothetical protein
MSDPWPNIHSLLYLLLPSFCILCKALEVRILQDYHLVSDKTLRTTQNHTDIWKGITDFITYFEIIIALLNYNPCLNKFESIRYLAGFSVFSVVATTFSVTRTHLCLIIGVAESIKAFTLAFAFFTTFAMLSRIGAALVVFHLITAAFCICFALFVFRTYFFAITMSYGKIECEVLYILMLPYFTYNWGGPSHYSKWK